MPNPDVIEANSESEPDGVGNASNSDEVNASNSDVGNTAESVVSCGIGSAMAIAATLRRRSVLVYISKERSKTNFELEG